MNLNAIVITKYSETLQVLQNFEEENAMILNIVGNTHSMEEGISLIKATRPNLVFLDYARENEHFFELLDKLETSAPKLIFISSDTSTSVKAFKYNAIDFIVKPIEFNSLIIGIYKAIKMIEMERIYQEHKVRSVNMINSNAQNTDYVAIPFLDKIELIQMSDIIYCQASGKYTDFHLLNGKKVMSSRNLGEYSAILDTSYFFRIHHSYILNLRHVTKISKKDGYYCELVNGIVLPVSTRRREDFNKFIKLKE